MLKRVTSIALIAVMMCVILAPTAQAATSVSFSGKTTIYVTTTSSWLYKVTPTKLTIKISDDCWSLFDKAAVDKGISGITGITSKDISKVTITVYKKTSSGSWSQYSSKNYQCYASSTLATIKLPGKSVQYKIVVSPVLSDTSTASLLKTVYGVGSASSIPFKATVNKGSVKK